MVTLLDGGVANRVPSAVLDLDRSATSRKLIATINTLQGLDVQYEPNSFSEATSLMKQGKIVGFIIIPSDFSQKVLSSRQPELSYYINFTYFPSGALMMKGYMLTAALSNMSVAKGVLQAKGANERQISAMLQPYVNSTHAIGNPWINYGVYLCNSFVPTTLALMILLMTTYTITIEIKRGTGIEWLRRNGDSIYMAVLTKLLPQTVLFVLVGWAILGIFYGIVGYPLNCPISHMLLAMVLYVIANQGFALLIVGLVPNPRLSMSVLSLFGILSFSLCGFSFPVECMYPMFQPVAYILPSRYYFLIYIDQALNGIDFGYSAKYYAALLVFFIVPLLSLWNIKHALRKNVYIP